MVSDVLGIFSKNGAKSSSSDPQGNGPDSAPLVTNNVPSGSSAPSFVDIQAQPAKKSADGSGQDSAPVSAADAARPVRDQVDLSALRTAQVAQVSQAVSDKTDTVGTAAPLRDLPSPYAPLPAEVSRRIADQVVQNLKLQVDGTTSDIRMTLKPPSLGEVQLSVHVEDSRMQAQINVTQQVVKTALEAHMPQLRQALQDHGIEVQRIDVMLPEPSLQHDGTGANGERAGRREGRRLLAGDDTEAFREAKDMGYNTIELIM
jgi:flagellar hook-length control protein FliK